MNDINSFANRIVAAMENDIRSNCIADGHFTSNSFDDRICPVCKKPYWTAKSDIIKLDSKPLPDLGKLF